MLDPIRLITGTTTETGQSEKRRVLLVEDNEVDARLVARHLRNLPVRVTVVGTMDGAVRTLGTGTFDCVIGDLGLPDAWPAAASDWYAGLAQQRVPVVVVSGCRGEVRLLRERCPWLPFVLAKEDLDGPSLRVFVAAAVRRAAVEACDPS
jgi:CheY-like chemotaxis protein